MLHGPCHRTFFVKYSVINDLKCAFLSDWAASRAICVGGICKPEASQAAAWGAQAS